MSLAYILTVVCLQPYRFFSIDAKQYHAGYLHLRISIQYVFHCKSDFWKLHLDRLLLSNIFFIYNVTVFSQMTLTWYSHPVTFRSAYEMAEVLHNTGNLLSKVGRGSRNFRDCITSKLHRSSTHLTLQLTDNSPISHCFFLGYVLIYLEELICSFSPKSLLKSKIWE